VGAESPQLEAASSWSILPLLQLADMAASLAARKAKPLGKDQKMWRAFTTAS